MNKRKTTGAFSRWAKKAKPLDWVIIAGIAAAFCIIIVLLFMIFNTSSKPVSVSSVSESVSSGSTVSSDSYNKDAVVVDTKKYGGTVLEETEDAGQSYIDDNLFIGDRNTVRMMSYGHTTLANDVAATSMGIQHVTTKPIVFFVGKNDAVTVPEAVKIIQPRRIVLTYGTNNTIGWSPKTFAEEYNKAIKAIEKAYPYADIIINSVPPVDKIRENPGVTMQTIDSFNSALAEMAKKEGYKYLNSAEALKDEGHGYAKTDYTISDGIHLSKKGMDELFSYIRTHSYETEDNRPKPLKAVPQRKETPPDIITEDPIFDRTQKKDDSDDSNAANSIKIEYTNANADRGGINGKISQTVAVGKTCETVTAIPQEGFAFGSWSCTTGRIDDPYNPTLSFVVPGTTDKTITVTANFVSASLYIHDAGGAAVSNISLNAGETFKPTIGFAPATYQHSKDFAATSSNTAVASVASDGTVTAVGGGDAVITYQALSGKLVAYLAVSVKSNTVPDPQPPVSSTPQPPVSSTPQPPVSSTPEPPASTPEPPASSTPASTPEPPASSTPASTPEPPASSTPPVSNIPPVEEQPEQPLPDSTAVPEG